VKSESNGTKRPNSLRIAVADDEVDTRQFLREILAHAGHTVFDALNGEQLLEYCRASRPDLIVTDIRMPALTGPQVITALNQAGLPTPVVLITGHPEADINFEDNASVMACLAKPVKPVDLLAAVELAMRRFSQFQRVAQEAASLRQALEDRKAIERAKGNVMKRLRVDEDEAYRRLQRVASERNAKLVDLARQIIAADEIYQQLDRQYHGH